MEFSFFKFILQKFITRVLEIKNNKLRRKEIAVISEFNMQSDLARNKSLDEQTKLAKELLFN